MNALLRAELLKLRTTRTFVAVVGVALALSLLVVGLIAILQDNFTEESSASCSRPTSAACSFRCSV